MTYQRADHAVFARPEFDPDDYANAILAGEAGKSKAGKGSSLEAAHEDVSVAISKLNFSTEDIEKQLKNMVTTHHEELLVQAAGVTELEASLSSVQNGLDELDSSLRTKIRLLFQSLQNNVSKLGRIQQASDILRRMSRFVILTRRLEVQLADMNKGESADTETSTAISKKDQSKPNESPLALIQPTELTSVGEGEDEKERTIAKAALTIAELTSLFGSSSSDFHPRGSPDDNTSEDRGHTIPLGCVKAVAAHLPYIEAVRARAMADMEVMVMTGLAEFNQSLLASSL
ncbi:uncharacterized protein LAESUDRAFT_757710 [Laetiporus sulphureus 93-53]|uniref:Conserved oligomeric Golgi complex subunit 5 N-terminal domain-containing protein n=1 Tax=Laetiporus sulphureus 93-53 TaxID=1314785 RepID=A0A165F6A8_9APHY|nr:uncharacterized protein LAESUDRAFT_757710 [Laetiporus sulphureus 93-53]KZT08476.1 hypothetical protein LAESUDRAFT_757710 [Laetiporus sulphureus 93-53]